MTHLFAHWLDFKQFERALHIPQSSSITGASSSDGLISHPRHSLGDGESPLSAEIQLLYYTAPANWATTRREKETESIKSAMHIYLVSQNSPAQFPTWVGGTL